MICRGNSIDQTPTRRVDNQRELSDKAPSGTLLESEGDENGSIQLFDKDKAAKNYDACLYCCRNNKTDGQNIFVELEACAAYCGDQTTGYPSG